MLQVATALLVEQNLNTGRPEYWAVYGSTSTQICMERTCCL